MKKLKNLLIFFLVIVAIIFFWEKCSSTNNYQSSSRWEDGESVSSTDWENSTSDPSQDWEPNPTPDRRFEGSSIYNKTPSWRLEQKCKGQKLYGKLDAECREYFRQKVVTQRKNETGLFDTISIIFFIGLAWYSLIAIPRTIWVIVGRAFGFYNPKVFNRFTRFGLPWRFFYRRLHNLRQWFATNLQSGKKATAKFASVLEAMSLVYKPNQIFLGRLSLLGIRLFQPVGIDGDSGRHITIVAGTGAGKTTYLMTMLGLHEGNMFVIDCDAQMYNSLRRRQGGGGKGILGKGKDVFILDPYNQSDTGVSASWNPIEEIDAAVARNGEDAAVGFAVALANALVKSIENDNKWVYDQAREFLAGLILFIYLDKDHPEKRNLLYLRELMTQGLKDADFADFDSFDVLIEAMKMKEEFGGKIAKAATIIDSNKDGSKSEAPLTEARSQTAWIDLPEIAKLLGHSDFKCEDLKVKDTSVFIAAPVGKIREELSGWVRALTMMTMEAFQRTQEKPRNACLFAIDEMPSLGRIPVLVDASAVFRKYKVRLITITQDIEKLKAAYPNEWGGFLGNSECVIWMATNNNETLHYLSETLGKATQKEKTKRQGMLLKKTTIAREDREIMSADQLGLYLGKNVIVTRYGNYPLKLKPAPYYTELPVYYYEADQNFGDKGLRAFTRNFIISRNFFNSRKELSDLE